MLRLSIFAVFACVSAVLSVMPAALAQQRLAATMPMLGRGTYHQDTVLSDFQNIQNSIVRILLPQENGPPRHNGTGFLITPDVVATSRHVAGTDDEIVIGFLDSDTTRFVEATAIGESEKADLSLFRLKSPVAAPPLRVARFAPGVGTRVAAIGFPQLVDRIMVAATPALTEGSIVQIGNGGHVLLHHAMLRPGNSGGPLLVRTPCGSVVIGVNTSIWADSTSYGYAESYYAARASIDLLSLAKEHGIEIEAVRSDSICPATVREAAVEKPPLITPAAAGDGVEYAALPPGKPADPVLRIRPPRKFRTPEMINLLRRAEDGLRQGNVSAARLLLERAQREGDPDATLLLAKTYDPDMLVRWGVRGTKGDREKARVLYKKARRLGAMGAGGTGLDLFGSLAPPGAEKVPEPEKKAEDPGTEKSAKVEAPPEPEPRAEPKMETVAAVRPPSPPDAPRSTRREIDLVRLLKRAQQDIRLGNVSAARLILQRIHEAKNPKATFLLAKTYDPYELARWGVRGMQSDPARARSLYKQALKLGMSEARIYLETLQ